MQQIPDPFLIDPQWVVQNISLNHHGQNEKQQVQIRLYSETTKDVIRVPMSLMEYHQNFREKWRLGRRVRMVMLWEDEMQPQVQQIQIPVQQIAPPAPPPVTPQGQQTIMGQQPGNIMVNQPPQQQ